jgi:hypothetical protein
MFLTRRRLYMVTLSLQELPQHNQYLLITGSMGLVCFLQLVQNEH